MTRSELAYLISALILAGLFVGATLSSVPARDEQNDTPVEAARLRPMRGRDVDMKKLRQLIERDHLSGREADYWSAPEVAQPDRSTLERPQGPQGPQNGE